MNKEKEPIPCVDCITLAICKGIVKRNKEYYDKADISKFELNEDSLWSAAISYMLANRECKLLRKYLDEHAQETTFQKHHKYIYDDYTTILPYLSS